MSRSSSPEVYDFALDSSTSPAIAQQHSPPLLPVRFASTPEQIHLSPPQPKPGPHTTFTPIVIHTAKCDGCDHHNTSVIQRCTVCSLQFCQGCLAKSMTDGRHLVHDGALDWTSGATAPTSLLAKGNAHGGPRKLNSRALVASGSGRVAKRQRNVARKAAKIQARPGSPKVNRQENKRHEIAWDSDLEDMVGETDEDVGFARLASARRAVLQSQEKSSPGPTGAATSPRRPRPSSSRRESTRRPNALEKLCREYHAGYIALSARIGTHGSRSLQQNGQELIVKIPAHFSMATAATFDDLDAARALIQMRLSAR